MHSFRRLIFEMKLHDIINSIRSPSLTCLNMYNFLLEEMNY